MGPTDDKTTISQLVHRFFLHLRLYWKSRKTYLSHEFNKAMRTVPVPKIERTMEESYYQELKSEWKPHPSLSRSKHASTLVLELPQDHLQIILGVIAEVQVIF